MVLEVVQMADKLTSAQLDDMFRHASGHDTMPAGWTRVGAWVRVSSGAQDEANQVPSIIRHCVDRKYWPARWYVIHSKSAFHGKHQADLDQAINDMRHGLITVLVIWHSDRLERRHERINGKSKTLPDTLGEFVDAGGYVESVQEPMLGKLDMGSQVSTFLAGLMNHEKSKHISDQVMLSIDRTKANNAVYNNVPWGFDIVGDKYSKKMVPTDVCREYVPQIFDRCIAGDSLRTIAAWLDAESVKPKRGGKWNESAIRWIIRNRAYAGRRLNREGLTIQTCEAVIDAGTFDRANNALRTRPKRGKQATGNKPMLAKLKCARCGSPMYRILAGEKGRKRYYYRCFGNGPQRKGCGNMVSYERTESMVAIRMLAWNDDPHQTRVWVEGKSWDAEIADVTQDIQELVQNPLAGDFLQRMAEKQAELADYTERNENRERGYWKFTDVLNDDGTLKTIGQYFHDLDPEARREYLSTHDIRAEKTAGDIRVIIDGLEGSPLPAQRSGLPSFTEKVGNLPKGTRERLGITEMP
jgi:site-specific DNA recombinase